MIYVQVLEIKFPFNGKEETIYPVVLKSEDETILVDCGYPGFINLIDNAAKVKGLSLQDLTGIIISHHDIDHVGALFEIKKKSPSIKVYSSGVEEEYISGKKKSARLQQAEDLFPGLPEDQKEGALYFQEMLKNVQAVEVDFTFSEDETLHFLGGVQVVDTPGHMPGHISLYVERTKTLIASDALVIENGEFEIANPGFTIDLDKAVSSVRRLLDYEIDEVICYHGGIMRGNIQPELKKLLAKYSRG